MTMMMMRRRGNVFAALLLLFASNLVAAVEDVNDTTRAIGECEASADGKDVTCSSKLATTPDPPVTTYITPPKMPRKIRALLHQDWNVLDPKGQEMIAYLSEVDAAVEFAHARTTFFEHLTGTFGILAVWGQPEVVRRTGLVHTAYSGDLFQFYLFNALVDTERQAVRDLLGEESEQLTYAFGTINRGQLCNFEHVIHPGRQAPTPITGPQIVDSRTNGTHVMVERDAAHILMVTIADYLDQMVETNGWRDHHMVESPGVLYPGDGRPAVGLYWMSALCNAVRPHLDVIPPVFHDCTYVIDYDIEKEARDLYWKVILQEAEQNMTESEQIETLMQSIDLNPLVGEPHIMLSQIYYRRGHFVEAGQHAATALRKLYQLVSAWDKRRSYNYWVGFARILLLRSNRSLAGQDSFPKQHDNKSAKDLSLVSLAEMLKLMKDQHDEKV